MMRNISHFYIYSYRFHDREVCSDFEEENNKSFYDLKKNEMDVFGYGLNTQNEPILLRFENDSFRPWLVLEVLDNSYEALIRRDLKKINGKFGLTKSNEIYMERYHVKSKLYFHNSKVFDCFRIFFASNKLRKIFAWKFRKDFASQYYHRYRLNENEASPLVQFLSQYNLSSCGWVEVHHGDEIPKRCRMTRYSIEYQILPNHVSQLQNQEIYPIPFFKSLSFDFEAYSDVETRIPIASNINNPVFQIGMTLNDVEGERNLLFSLSKSKTIRLRNCHATDVKCFETEQQLLKEFCNFICIYNPIIIMGYNIFGFDIPFLYRKCQMYNIDIHRCGMLKNYESAYLEIKWSSTAFRCQEFHFYDFDGRISIDMLPILQKNYKLHNYKLNTVCRHILKNQTKDPMTPMGIFEAYRKGFLEGKDTNLLMKCGKYCVQDARLVRKLFEVTQTLITLLEMAKLCNTQLMDLYVKGEQLKVFSQLYKICFKEGRIVDAYENISPELKSMFEFDNYTGAFVFPPVPGKYSWVLPFDFTSLYPTTIIANNICYTTFVIDDTVEDRECHVISWEDGDKKYRFRFKKKPIGVIPALLTTLLEQRNTTKRELKKSEGFIKTILDKRQLAYKISANSCYGMMGVRKGFLPFLPGAMATTAMGRQYISKAADYVSKTFQGKIVYGDSIHRNTIIYIKYNNKEIKLFPIETFFMFFRVNILPYDQFKSDISGLSHKQQIIFNSDKYKIMSFNGWSNIKRLIRHYTTKRLFQVYTTSGSIIVTEDHSLLLPNKIEIKPSQLVVNEHTLANIDNTLEIAEKLEYQKEEWNCTYSQENGYIQFGQNSQNKYISYIYFSYLQKFPNAIFTFFLTNENEMVYGIDLYNRQEKEKGLVLKIEDLGSTTDFVYDIETFDGSFHAGISLLVKNTDSIYVNFNNIEKNSKIVWKYAKQIENHLIERNLFPKPMKLLFESKIYQEFLILTKKKYMAYTCGENGVLDEDLTIRGVLLARRDNCLWHRKIYEIVVRLIMENNSFSHIIDVISNYILDLFQWNTSSTVDTKDKSFDINEFVISRSYNEDYKVRPLPNEISKIFQRLDDLGIDYKKNNIIQDDIPKYNRQIEEGKSKNKIIENYIHKSYPAHVQLALKMATRGQPVATGSRIEFVICKFSNDPNEKLIHKLEDPTFFKSFCDIYRLDRLHYAKSTVTSLDQLLNISYLKICPKNCHCYSKIKTTLEIKKKKNNIGFFDKKSLRKSKNNIKIGPIPIQIRSKCNCPSSCPCKKNRFNPIDSIYNVHLQHLKVMDEIKTLNKTKILIVE